MRNKTISIMIILLMFFILTSCKKDSDLIELEISSEIKEDLNVTKEFVRGFITDDSQSLENIITKEYSLQELKNFFEGLRLNECLFYGTDNKYLSIREVNENFPIECLRENGYSVYRVSEGGYFYVFWTKTFDPMVNKGLEKSSDDATVYFTTYISSLKTKSDFNSIVVDVCTANDVYRIDESFELNFLLSNGIYSYSFLNNESIMQIKYNANEKVESYDDLVVKEMSVVKRDNSPSVYSSILSKDLPD